MEANPRIHRFSETVFRRYEPVLFKVATDFDKPFIFNLDGSDETHLARVRDAARSLLVNRWETDFSYDDFKDAWKTVAVTRAQTSEGIMVYDKINPNHRVNDVVLLEETASISGSSGKLSFDNPTNAELDAILLLVNNNRFDGEAIKLTSVATAQQEYLKTNELPNTIVDQLDATTFIVL